MEILPNSSGNPPWIELLDSLIEEIIEKLPLVDYIRFGVICKRWNVIQKEHRLRYSPKPPPIASSVVLVNYRYCRNESKWENHEELLFHLPFEPKKYHIPLPYPSPMGIYDSCYGWLLTYYNPNPFTLSLDHFHVYNPVTGVTIDLPLYSYHRCLIFNGSLSAPPTDPNCCVIIATNNEVSVLCLGDFSWKKVEIINDVDSDTFGQFVSVNGKFYRISSFARKSLSIVDPFLPKPTEQILELDMEEMIEDDEFEKDEKLTAVDGELFLVTVVYVHDELIKRFHVFRANFTTRKWIRVTSLGDHAMLLSDNVKSLQVNSVEGFRKNMIYFTQKFYVDEWADCESIMRFRVSWMAFDIDSQEIVEGTSFLYDKFHLDVEDMFMLFWFFPTI